MSPRRTFLDAGVLIAAARGTDEMALQALEILDDPNRAFVSSVFVKLGFFQKPFTIDSRKRRSSTEAFSRMTLNFGLASAMSC